MWLRLARSERAPGAGRPCGDDRVQWQGAAVELAWTAQMRISVHALAIGICLKKKPTHDMVSARFWRPASGPQIARPGPERPRAVRRALRAAARAQQETLRR